MNLAPSLAVLLAGNQVLDRVQSLVCTQVQLPVKPHPDHLVPHLAPLLALFQALLPVNHPVQHLVDLPVELPVTPRAPTLAMHQARPRVRRQATHQA